MRTYVKIAARVQQSVPELDAPVTRVVKLIRELPHEADADRPAPNARDRDLAMVQIREGVVVEFVGAQPLEESARVGSRDIDGSPAGVRSTICTSWRHASAQSFSVASTVVAPET